MNQIIHLSKAKLLNTLPINDLCGNNKQKRNIAVLFVVVIVYMAINIGAFSVTTTMNNTAILRFCLLFPQRSFMGSVFKNFAFDK